MAMGQNAKPMPQLDQQSTKELNLTVLQRMDKHIEDILATAGHVTLYEFNMELNGWSRKDVEGSLFVVKRRMQPRFQFIVMNRRSVDNLVEDLLSNFEYDVQVPYLLYRNAAQEVNGIWFYNPRECAEVAKLFSRILNAFSKIPPKPKLINQQSEFQELEAVPTSAVVEGPLEPASILPEETLDRFFNNSLQLSAAAPELPSSQPISAPLPIIRSSPPASNVTPMPVPAPILSMASISAAIQEPAEGTVAPLLVKPSFFMAPAASAAPSLSSHPTPLAAPPVLQPSHGAPLLQPFPPPAPPPSLTPVSSSSISREGVRDALLRLVQTDQFIDLIYREMQNAHSK